MTNALTRRIQSVAGGFPREFWVLFAGMLVNRAGSFVLPFLAIYLTQARGFSIATAGAVVALYGAGAAVASPLGGYLADHIGRRAVMVAALALGGLGMIALGFARGLEIIAPACFVIAMVGEAYRPAMQAAVTDLVPAHDRIRAFGLIYWAINLGFSIGATLGGVLATTSFTLLFVGDGLTSLMFGLLVWRMVPETRPARAAGAEHARSSGALGGFFAPYRDHAFAAFVLLSVAVMLIFMQQFTSLPIDMALRGVSRPMIGAIIGLNGILIVFVQPLLAPALGRWNRSRMLAGGSALIGIGFGMYAIASSPLVYALGVAVWTVGEIFVLPVSNAVVADIAPAHMRGRYQGAYGLSFGLAAFGAPLFGSLVLQHFGTAALWIACLATGVVAGLGHLLLGPRLARLRESRLGEPVAH